MNVKNRALGDIRYKFDAQYFEIRFPDQKQYKIKFPHDIV